MNASPEGTPRSALFLPDFCGIRIVFAVVVVGELLAVLLTLDPDARTHGGFRELALTSLFVQWAALPSAALLCLSRRVLVRFGDRAAALYSYALILAVTALVSEVAYWGVLPRIGDPAAAALWEFEHGPGGVGIAPAPVVPMQHVEFLLRNLGIAAIVAAAVLRYFFVQHQWRARMESESRARIQALQSRIRPHFLFNSMNTIASLARSEPALAEQVTEDLAALFRVSLGDASEPGTLAQELEVCQGYLRIEQQRLGERLHAETDVAAVPGDALLPALTLQPLIENAIYHGVEPATQGGSILVRGTCDGERIRLSVENTVPPSAERAHRDGNRMALDNVRQRVEAFFAGAASVSVSPGNGRFRVDIEFPYRTEGA